MYVFMYLCMHVSVYVFLCVRKFQSINIDKHGYTYVYIYIHIHTYIESVCMYVFMHACMHACMYV